MKENQKVGNSISGQYVTQLGTLYASPHHGRQTLDHSSVLLDRISAQNQQCISYIPVSISGGINSSTTL